MQRRHAARTDQQGERIRPAAWDAWVRKARSVRIEASVRGAASCSTARLASAPIVVREWKQLSRCTQYFGEGNLSIARCRTTFPGPDRDDIAVFVDCMFRYASEDAFINLRAFHDPKKDAPPLFIEPVKIGAPDLVDRIRAPFMTQRHMLNLIVFARLSPASQNRTAQRSKNSPKASLSASSVSATQVRL